MDDVLKEIYNQLKPYEKLGIDDFEIEELIYWTSVAEVFTSLKVEFKKGFSIQVEYTNWETPNETPRYVIYPVVLKINVDYIMEIRGYRAKAMLIYIMNFLLKQAYNGRLEILAQKETD